MSSTGRRTRSLSLLKSMCLVVLHAGVVATIPSSISAVTVAHYNLNEGNGTMVLDSSGFGNDGNIVDAAYTTEVPPEFPTGFSLEFNPGGGSDRVVIPDDSSLRPATGVTVSAWVKLRSVVGPNSHVIVGKQVGGNGADSYVLYVAGPGPEAGKVAFSAHNGASQIVVIGPSIADGEWHDVAGVLRNGNLEIYVDTVLQASIAFPGAIAYDGDPVTVGNDLNGNAWVEAWNGVIDEVQIGNTGIPLGIETPPGSPRATLVLDPGKPNPFHLMTAVGYHLPESGPVTLHVIDASGRSVRVLVDGHREAGPGQVEWDGRDHEGRLVGPGVYFFRLRAADQMVTEKVVLTR